MENTVIQMDMAEDYVPVIAYLTAHDATGEPDSAGYTLSSSGAMGFQFTVPENCVGIYRVTAHDSDGIAVAQGYVWIEADDTSTYVANATHSECWLQRFLTENVGTDGAELGSIPWNSVWDAEVQSECADALTAYGAATAANVTSAQSAIISQVTTSQGVVTSAISSSESAITSQVTTTQGVITSAISSTESTITNYFPANFAALGINSSGHILRVVLVDTTTENTDVTTLEYDVTQAIATTIISNVISGLTALKPQVISAYDPSDYTLEIFEGDDHKIADGSHIDIPINLPTSVVMGSSTASFLARHRTYPVEITGTPTLVEVDSQHFARLEFDADDTALAVGELDYIVKITYSENVHTVAAGGMRIKDSLQK